MISDIFYVSILLILSNQINDMTGVLNVTGVLLIEPVLVVNRFDSIGNWRIA